MTDKTRGAHPAPARVRRWAKSQGRVNVSPSFPSGYPSSWKADGLDGLEKEKVLFAVVLRKVRTAMFCCPGSLHGRYETVTTKLNRCRKSDKDSNRSGQRESGRSDDKPLVITALIVGIRRSPTTLCWAEPSSDSKRPKPGFWQASAAKTAAFKLSHCAIAPHMCAVGCCGLHFTS
jgi:hypothetical protein